MRDIKIVKYRKLLQKLQNFCRQGKVELDADIFSSKHNLTDFEKGLITGQHMAYNDVLRKIERMRRDAEFDWKTVTCREETLTK